MDSMENKKSCPQCGEEVQSIAKFCGNCGYHFPAEETVQPSVETDHIEEIKIPAPPVIDSFVTPTPEQSADNGANVTAPEQPVNNVVNASTPVQPINNEMNASTPVQPVNNGINASTPVQPANGSYSSSAYTQPSYPPYSPVQPPQKKGKGGLIALLSVIGVLVLAATVLVLGVLLGWFKKDTIELSESKVTVVMEEEVTVEVENYKEIGKPELTATVQEGKEDLIEVEVDGDEIIVTGIEEGKNITVTVSAKGCEDATFKVTVEEPEPEPEPVVTVESLSGTAWNAEEFRYYFLENGMMYMICEDYEDYIKGTYTVSDITQEEAAMYNVSGISDGVYFEVDVDVEQELYYGNEYNGEDYFLIVGTNGEDCAIYDSGWAETVTGTSANMESESDLESYFDMASNGGNTGSIANGSVPGINFGDAINVKETWHIAEYDTGSGDILIFKKDGNLWGANESGNTQQLTALDADSQVTIFAVYEDYLFYGVGQKEEGGEEVFYADTNAFYMVDLTNDSVVMLSDDITLKDFVIYNDYVYYTDYSTLYKMDFEGNTETLYEDGVFTFEVTSDYIFIFDGYAWEVIDPEDGTDYGYMTITNGEYEADVVRHEDEMIFFTTYNYDDGNIYLYAMDYDGNVTQIGDADWGESWDTYNVTFDDEYVFYTVNGGEVIVKTDVTSGTYETMTLADYDYYYATGMVQCGDNIYLYVRDYNNDVHYLELDEDNLSVSEIPGLN